MQQSIVGIDSPPEIEENEPKLDIATPVAEEIREEPMAEPANDVIGEPDANVEIPQSVPVSEVNVSEPEPAVVDDTNTTEQ